MKSSIAKVAILAAAVLLSACAPQEIPYDRTDDIKIVGVLTPGLPPTPTARTATDVGQSFGLIGALVDASIESARSDKLNAMMTAQNFVPGTALTQNLTDALQAKGYTAKPVAVGRNPGDFLKAYPAPSDSGVDAYLD